MKNTKRLDDSMPGIFNQVAKTINWNVKKQDALLITEITKRAIKGCPKSLDYLTLNMDITATHCNGNPLRLQDFLDADEYNFWHDVYGINNNIDRKTGKLRNCFLPRFSE